MKNVTEERISTADFGAAGNRGETAEQPAEKTDSSAGTLLPQGVVQDLRNQWTKLMSSPTSWMNPGPLYARRTSWWLLL